MIQSQTHSLVYVVQLKDQMRKTSPETIAANKDEMAEWVVELDRLQALTPVEAARTRLRDVELPTLEKQIREQEAAIPAISAKAEEVREKFHDAYPAVTDAVGGSRRWRR